MYILVLQHETYKYIILILVPFPSSHPYLDIIFDATELPTLKEQINYNSSKSAKHKLNIIL